MTVTIFLRGGLGNQLFQYAAGLYLSRMQEEELEIRHDLLPIEWDNISGIPRCPVQVGEFKFEGRLSCKMNQPTGGTHFVSKRLQLQRVFADIFPNSFLRFGILAGESKIHPDFSSIGRIRKINSYCFSRVPAQSLGDSLRMQLKEVVNPSSGFLDLVGEAYESAPIIMHVRLGDHLRLTHLYGATDFESVKNEVNRVRELRSRPVWLFSDSPWTLPQGLTESLRVEKIVGPETIESPIENLVLMSLGSHFVAANSTLSWWVAFLKGEGDAVSFPANLGSRANIFSPNMILSGWKSFD